MGSPEVEKQIRYKNRQDDQKCKDEKGKEQKLRLKKQEKRRTEKLAHDARQAKKLNTTAEQFASGLNKGEASIEQALRESIMKPPGNIET